VPDYEVMPSGGAGDKRRRRHKKKKMGLTVERYGGRLVYIWYGMRFMALMRLFWRGRFSFTLNCIPDTLALFIWVPWNTPLAWITELLYKRKADRLPLDTPPIFVVGHWRSGTTLMHDLLQRRAHGYHRIRDRYCADLPGARRGLARSRVGGRDSTASSRCCCQSAVRRTMCRSASTALRKKNLR